ncbi:sulfite exporter TauE/SafE family protein [Nakamurella endophytica]|uniref:sulfite exporter TauE/SafE family protein n=1 Tax=Nakamurella endophytica TaxID=1748367 RepID=UPI00166E3BF3|nr:sulfite exporter TauE/SafE family protein [Nakamurella endophytica]
MSLLELVLILLAGVWAGLINTIVGSGTLVTFPTMVAFGFQPVVATMSNAVGLVAGGVSGTWGYRRELQGQWARLAWQMPGSLLGAVVGAWLLLHLPADTFKKVVPVLLVLALVLVVTQPRIQRWVRRRAEQQGRDHQEVGRGRLAVLVLCTFVAGVYGGYFAAAQGILLVGIMGVLLPESMQRINAAKNLLSLVVNVVAATAYTVVGFHRINWAAAGLIAAGSLVGGFLGASVGRRLSPTVLRAVIVVLGVVAIWRLLAS